MARYFFRACNPDHHHYVSKSTKRSLLKHGRARELEDGSLEEVPSLSHQSPEGIFTDDVKKGEWRARRSGPVKVMQFTAVRERIPL